MAQLSHADQSAIDTMLMNGNSTSPTAAPAASSQRLDAAARLLSLLDALPETEVPPALAERTVQRIQRAVYGKDAQPPSSVGAQDPIA